MAITKDTEIKRSRDNSDLEDDTQKVFTSVSLDLDEGDAILNHNHKAVVTRNEERRSVGKRGKINANDEKKGGKKNREEHHVERNDRHNRSKKRPTYDNIEEPTQNVRTENGMKTSEKVFNCCARYRKLLIFFFACMLFVFVVTSSSVVILVTTPKTQFNSALIDTPNPTTSFSPTTLPSQNPSFYPSILPSNEPSQYPSMNPSTYPTLYPSSSPSEFPSVLPTLHISTNPSSKPSEFPSNIPSQYPSIHPSLHPTHPPTSFPTHKPTISIMPSHSPTKYPTQEPTIHPTSAPTGSFVNFFIMGDIPYDKKEARNLERTLQTMPNDASFIIHVGDINRAKKGCPLENYENVRRIFLQAPLPFFLIPGDNDWNDCSNTTEAWSFWTGNFDQLHRNWSHDLPVTHQTNRTENFAFFLEDFVLFIGLNIVGGDRHDRTEWETRLDSQLKWTEQLIDSYMDRGLTTVVVFGHAIPVKNHRTFFRGFVENAKNQYSDLHFLYTHGDGHMWEVEKKFQNADNILRVQVDDGNDVPFYQVRVESHANIPFLYTEFKDW